MRVISRKKLQEFAKRHTDAKDALDAWYKYTENATWKSGNEVASQYPYTRPIEDNRVIFNIMGNKYRLVVRIEYQRGIVYIRFIGTHAEYDRIDAGKI
jgi:mRNA interferase HigB